MRADLNQSPRLSKGDRTPAHGGANPLPEAGSEPHRPAQGRTPAGRSGRNTDAVHPRIRTHAAVAVLTLVTATLLIGLTFGTAHADAFAPAANPYLQRYEQAATTLWGPVPADQCPTGVEYLFPPSDPFALPVDDPDTPEDDTVEATARAELNGCEIWLIFWPRLEGDRIDRWWVYAQNMATVLHEWRHLQGFDHDVRGLNNWGDTDRQAVRYAERLATARYGDPDVVTLGASKPVRKHRPAPAVKRCRGACATFAKDFDDGSTPDPIEAGGHLRKR